MNAESLFLEAVEIEDRELRLDYVESAATDESVKDEVLELLRAHDEPDHYLEHPVGGGETLTRSAVSESPGTMIGRYKLLQQIGEGGFGVVFMAERTGEIQQKVAVKIVKPGMDTKEVIARFEAERQAIAMMDHSNIARVIDAGTTDSGRPYFVMELVRGVPITEYCDEAKMATEDRLQLFMQVCSAIQHAHQKGIIHRDIKPSNILVTKVDGQPIPKVIDFGVAKALNQRLTNRTLFTSYGHMIGTPQYMSPEQAELTALEVDTRSDIYSLGVVLYELLTGTTPLIKERMRSAAFDELRRVIREEEAERPSHRVSTLGEKASVVADKQGAAPKSLHQYLKGDLDWIVLKALEKSASRRYDSPKDFAADIDRFLATRPIEARPPSLVYRTGKAIKRNARTLLATSVMLIISIVGLVSYYSASRPIDPLVLADAGQNHFEAGECDQAIAYLEQAKAGLRKELPLHAETFASVVETLASAYLIEGQYIATIETLDQGIDALRMNDNQVATQLIAFRKNAPGFCAANISVSETRSDSHRQALRLLDKHGQDDERDNLARALATAFLDPDAAMEILSDAPSTSPHGQFPLVASIILSFQNRHDEAEAVFSIGAYQVDSTDWMLRDPNRMWGSFGQYLRALRQKAVEVLELKETLSLPALPEEKRFALLVKATKCFPDWGQAHRILAYEYVLRDQYEKAMMEYELAFQNGDPAGLWMAGALAIHLDHESVPRLIEVAVTQLRDPEFGWDWVQASTLVLACLSEECQKHNPESLLIDRFSGEKFSRGRGLIHLRTSQFKKARNELQGLGGEKGAMTAAFLAIVEGELGRDRLASSLLEYAKARLEVQQELGKGFPSRYGDYRIVKNLLARIAIDEAEERLAANAASANRDLSDE